jgi:hypothetical protein
MKKTQITGGAHRIAFFKTVIGGVDCFTPELMEIFPLKEGKRRIFLCVKF